MVCFATLASLSSLSWRTYQYPTGKRLSKAYLHWHTVLHRTELTIENEFTRSDFGAPLKAPRRCVEVGATQTHPASSAEDYRAGVVPAQ